MIKLIAIDMDGTLLDSNKKIPAENIVAIQKAAAAGIKVVLCTGRPKSGILPYFKELGLTEEEYIIMNNGCTIYSTKNWELMDYAQVTTKELESLYQATQSHPDVCLTLTGEENYYAVANKVPMLVQYDADLVFAEAKSISLEEVKKSSLIIFQAMYMAEESLLDSFQNSKEAELSQDFSVVRSQDYIFEVMPKGHTKASALKSLSEKLGFSPDQVMALGDAANDLEMLEFATHSVAMGNATEDIKKRCRYVTSSNDEAGVAKAIYDYAL